MDVEDLEEEPARPPPPKPKVHTHIINVPVTTVSYKRVPVHTVTYKTIPVTRTTYQQVPTTTTTTTTSAPSIGPWYSIAAPTYSEGGETVH